MFGLKGITRLCVYMDKLTRYPTPVKTAAIVSGMSVEQVKTFVAALEGYEIREEQIRKEGDK